MYLMAIKTSLKTVTLNYEIKPLTDSQYKFIFFFFFLGGGGAFLGWGGERGQNKKNLSSLYL